MPKINVNVADNDGGTALLYAAYVSYNLNILSILEYNIFNVTYTDQLYIDAPCKAESVKSAIFC